MELENNNKSKIMSKSYGKSMYEKSVPTSVKLTLKGGIAVEPQSGLEHMAHVYKHNNDVWNANLCLSDVQTGKNSYYKIQLLESDNNNRYYNYLMYCACLLLYYITHFFFQILCIPLLGKNWYYHRWF